MNKVCLIGNLTRDPELTETSGGVSVCRFTIAVTRSYTNGDGERETDFFNCTAWRGLAESIAKYCRKGNKVAVAGSIQMRTYEGNDGVKRTAVDVIVQECTFLTQRTQQPQDDFYDAPAPSERSAPAQKKPVLESFDDDYDDLPF